MAAITLDAAGQFHAWAVETRDEGIKLLTGHAGGTRGADAVSPEGSVPRRVEDRLRAYANRPRDFAGSPDGRTDHRGAPRLAPDSAERCC